MHVYLYDFVLTRHPIFFWTPVCTLSSYVGDSAGVTWEEGQYSGFLSFFTPIFRDVFLPHAVLTFIEEGVLWYLPLFDREIEFCDCNLSNHSLCFSFHWSISTGIERMLSDFFLHQRGNNGAYFRRLQ